MPQKIVQNTFYSKDISFFSLRKFISKYFKKVEFITLKLYKNLD